MKTKVKLMSKDSGEVEFVTTKTEKKDGNIKLVLKTSKGGSWNESYKNQKLIEIKDDGNSIEIKFRDTSKNISLDYSQFEELFLVMREYILTEPNLMSDYERLVSVKDCKDK